jgi:hypothetical protein
MRKILLWVVVGLFAMIVLTIGISALQTKSRTDKEKTTATTFVQKVLSDDTDGTYSMFSSKARNGQAQEDWNAQVDKLSSFFKDRQATLKDIKTSGTSTTVTFTITGTDGNYIMTVVLVNSKGESQVQSFTSLLTLS